MGVLYRRAWAPKPVDGYHNGRSLKRKQKYTVGDYVIFVIAKGHATVSGKVVGIGWNRSKYTYECRTLQYPGNPNVAYTITTPRSRIRGLCGDEAAIAVMKLSGL